MGGSITKQLSEKVSICDPTMCIMSTSTMRKGELDLDKKDFIDKFELFILSAYHRCNSDASMKAIIKNSRSRSFFVEFIILNGLLAQYNVVIGDGDAEFMGILHSCLIAILGGKWEAVFSQKEFQQECVNIFPQFVKSQLFKDWRRAERKAMRKHFERRFQTSIASTTSSLPLDSLSNRRNSSGESNFSLNQNITINQDSTAALEIINYNEEYLAPLEGMDFSKYCPVQQILSIFHTFDNQNQNLILLQDINIFELLCSIEDLPIACTIAQTSMPSKGFPLCYVNKEFEELSGYSRPETIGKDCRMLLRSDRYESFWEPTTLAKMDEALVLGKKCITTITNFHKSGELFRNYIYFKPIIDLEGNYIYVISLQFRVNESEKHMNREYEMAEKLMDAVPLVIRNTLKESRFLF